MTTTRPIGRPDPVDEQPASPAARPVGGSQLEAMLSVSHAVGKGGPLPQVLDAVAAAAASVTPGVHATSIILTSGHRERRLRIAGSYGLSPEYRRALNGASPRLEPGKGPSGLAFRERRPVLIDDVERDERFSAWRPIARQEGYAALVTIPLIVGDLMVGTVNAYRRRPGSWSPEEVGLLTLFSDHAATAVRTAQLLDQQQRQVVTLRRLVRGLREQTHEHANRLHAVCGLLAIGEIDEAQRFLHALEMTNNAARELIERHVLQPVLAGLLVAESAIAAQRNITLEIDDTGRISALPRRLSETQAVTIIGNLLDNAYEAVAEMERPRRRVRLRITDEGAETTIEVRDWGSGLTAGLRNPFARGETTKPGHPGVGLTLVADAVAAAVGHVHVREHEEGLSVTVAVPND